MLIITPSIPPIENPKKKSDVFFIWSVSAFFVFLIIFAIIFNNTDNINKVQS